MRITPHPRNNIGTDLEFAGSIIFVSLGMLHDVTRCNFDLLLARQQRRLKEVEEEVLHLRNFF